VRATEATLAIALLLGACGSGAARPTRTTAVTSEDEAPSIHPPELVWSPGADRVVVRGIGVAFTVRAPLSRLARDELATDACGDRMVHAMVVDRRSSPEIESILARALMRAGCTIPDEGHILGATRTAHEHAMRVRFDGGALHGEWSLRAVVLDRAHRSVAIVSAVRVAPDAAPETLFEIVDDAPGLEGVGAPPTAVADAGGDAREAVDFAFGVVRVVGEVMRIFAP
jgi:hypothetical protein